MSSEEGSNTIPASAASSSSSSAACASPPSRSSLPTLGVEYPPDHPIARRASKLQVQKVAQEQAEVFIKQVEAEGKDLTETNITPLPSPTKEVVQAHILEQFSAPLSVPSSPAEITRRMSIGPSSRRNSILAIPPIQETLPPPLDHLPEAGTDVAVDLAEIEKEIEEIDTFG